MQDIPDKVCQIYNLADPVIKNSLTGGIINQSFQVETTGGQYLVGQKIKNKPGFAAGIDFLDVAENWTRNYLAVHQVLKPESFNTGIPLTTTHGDLCYRHDEIIWRFFTYIENDPPGVPDAALIKETGFALGRFHRRIQETPHRPLFPIPGFHDTGKFLARLEKISADAAPDKKDPVSTELDLLLTVTPAYFLPANLPPQVIHGDPKLTNFLFRQGKVVGIIDLDTMMPGSIYLDIGDALRSWCRLGNRFQPDLCVAAMSGYTEGLGKKPKWPLVKKAVKLITLELAARFLIDYFEESYFQWDSQEYSSAAAHNLARCRKYLAYFQTI